MQFRYEVTAGSTQADDAQRARRLPPDLLARTNTDLDELCHLRAEKEAQAARGPQANKVKVNRVRCAIVTMVWLHRRQIRAWPEGKRESRALHLRSCIEGAITLSDDGQGIELNKPPT